MISEQEINRLAELARLQFSDTEKKELAYQLNRILDYMKKIDELELSESIDIGDDEEKSTPLREDEAKQNFSAEQALQNAPKRNGDFFVVPKVVRKSS